MKSHPWFKNLDWSLIENKMIIPPFTPNLDGDDDFKYFDAEFTTQVINSYSEHPSLSEEY